MPGGFGAYIEGLREILRMAGRRGTSQTRLRTKVEAQFGKNAIWLRSILSFLVNARLLRQDGDRIYAPQASPSPERVIRALHGSIKFVGEMLAEIERGPLTYDGVAEAARRHYGLELGGSRINDRRGWLQAAGMITAAGKPRELRITPKGKTFLGNLRRQGQLVAPVDPVTPAPAPKRGGGKAPGTAASVIPPNDSNLESARATGPLTAWLVHAAKSRGTMTYGQVKRRLESECNFGDVFPVRIGRVAGAAMDRILEHSPRAPLLNVLVVQTATGLPGSGAAGYLARRNAGSRWLRRRDAHGHPDWRTVVEEEARQVYAYPHWDELYRQIYGSGLPGPAAEPPGREKDGTRANGGEGPNHRALRLRVLRDPSLVRRGLRAENTATEVELLSGDRVDVVAFAPDRTVAIEVKSKDSDWADLRRGVYQCVKYRAVLAAQDIRQDPVVESWLVTEEPLPNDLRALARRLEVRTREVAWRG